MVECNVSETRLNFVPEVCIFKRGRLSLYLLYKCSEKHSVVGIWLEWFVNKDLPIAAFSISCFTA